MKVFDLAKVLDTINHLILLSKLDHYGIRETPLEWFKTYLSDKQQQVCYNDIISDIKCIQCGVPQRTILGPGPLLFLA